MTDTSVAPASEQRDRVDGSQEVRVAIAGLGTIGRAVALANTAKYYVIVATRRDLVRFSEI